MILTKSLFALIILILFTSYYLIFFEKPIYVKSTIDNKYYLVRNLPDKQTSADTLAYIRNRLLYLTNHMLASTPYELKQYFDTLNYRLQNVIISENIHDIYYTSYSVNKGEHLVFCMRSRKYGSHDHKHDLNLMMYVALHELSHIACPEYGHTELFTKIFKHIIENAIYLGIYTPIDFKMRPIEYCGMYITNSFD